MVGHDDVGIGSASFSYVLLPHNLTSFNLIYYHNKMKSKTTATILCFFLGGFGIHRFYLGQSGIGLLYLLFCWTFIPAFLALIDFIRLLLMSDEQFNQKYNLTALILKGQQAQPNSNVVAINMGMQHHNPVSSTDEIKKLYELKEKGIITQEEFELKKKTVL